MNDALKVLVADKVAEIKDCIVGHVFTERLSGVTHGIMGDDFGMLLFLYHYARVMDDKKVEDVAQTWVEHVTEKLSDGLHASYSEC